MRSNQFERKLIKLDTGCWIWPGSTINSGYGQTTMNSVHMTVHRAAWRYFVGPIPDGLLVLHKCDVKLCCNPAHLYLGDKQNNAWDMVDRKGTDHCFNSGKTHCCRGHEFTVENTRVSKSGKRECIECKRLRTKGLI